MKLPWSDRSAHARVEELLRAGAGDFAPAPPPELRARILDAVRAAPARAGARPAPVGRERLGTWLAVAAAALVLVSAWWLTSRPAASRARSASVVALSRGLLGAGTRFLALPGEAEANLRGEAARLLSDTTRLAEGIVRGLPAPLRERLSETHEM